jgi:hypothetical protein
MKSPCKPDQQRTKKLAGMITTPQRQKDGNHGKQKQTKRQLPNCKEGAKKTPPQKPTRFQQAKNTHHPDDRTREPYLNATAPKHTTQKRTVSRDAPAASNSREKNSATKNTGRHLET